MADEEAKSALSFHKKLLLKVSGSNGWPISCTIRLTIDCPTPPYPGLRCFKSILDQATCLFQAVCVTKSLFKWVSS